MTLQELMPQIDSLSEDDKKELCSYLLKELGEDGTYALGCVHDGKVQGNISEILQGLLEDAKARV